MSSSVGSELSLVLSLLLRRALKQTTTDYFSCGSTSVNHRAELKIQPCSEYRAAHEYWAISHVQI